MTLTNAYCTVAQLQQRLGRETKLTDERYSFLEESIARATKYIEEATGKKFYQQTLANEYIDIYQQSPNGFVVNYSQDQIYCAVPIITLTSLYEDDVLLVADTDYYAYKENGFIEKSNWTSSRKGIKFNGVIGYATTPKHIENICLCLAEIFSGLGVKIISDGAGGQAAMEVDYIPKWVEEALQKERRINV